MPGVSRKVGFLEMHPKDFRPSDGFYDESIFIYQIFVEASNHTHLNLSERIESQKKILHFWASKRNMNIEEFTQSINLKWAGTTQ